MADPYCEHPECHSRFTAQYARAYTTNGWPPANEAAMVLLGETRPVQGYRRWCSAHALIFEGWCWG